MLKSPNIFLNFFTLSGVSIFVLYILKLLLCVRVHVCTRICMCIYIWDAYLFLSVCLCVISNNFPYSKVHFACLLVATTSFFLLPIPPFYPLPLTVSCYTVPMYIHVPTCARTQIQHPKALSSGVLGLQVPAFHLTLILQTQCWWAAAWPTFPDLSLCVIICAVRSESLVDNTWSYLALKKNHSQYCCLLVMC